MKKYIDNKLSVDTFRTKRKKPYLTSYSQIGEVAKVVAEQNVKPEFKKYLDYNNNYEYVLFCFQYDDIQLQLL
ncbi:hypothetical protein [Spiroplasma tabanidicola]|uniref:Uncharacterized protein n=1 Tax=Spiroplasma tabanidicola TaxID=324079 RepID=A0A6I6CI61_9MOLU|nr:hypothetical protein [Spiroplasma tabanidicola]QGS51743.1 hypothetical protein STABA_v1c03800 [Spiroplasma tabanidicola]